MTILTYVIVGLTILLFIASIIFFPKFKFGKFFVSSYWVITLLGALLLLCFKCVNLNEIKNTFLSNDNINPLKILALFISMTVLSIFLDTQNFFSYLAILIAKRFSKNQYVLFFALYFLISILTIFTSNDIIILTFTPFLCYFAKKTNINPIPYLFMEFVAANTWSMMLIIGNPTNIYLASYENISFFEYAKVMFIPTLGASLTSLALLFLLFKKSLKKQLEPLHENTPKINKIPVIFGLFSLFTTTILLSLSSYLNLEMWIIAFGFASLTILFAAIYSLCTKQNHISPLLKRIPLNLIPFVLSMFLIVLALKDTSLPSKISSLLQSTNQVFSYGFSGMIAGNLINNIPMAVFYATLLQGAQTKAIYASVIASNLCAYLTPIGALAGIMWMNLVKEQDIKINYLIFTEKGCILSIPALAIALLTLNFIPI